MELPYPSFQWSVQLDPSPAVSYAPSERIDREVQNPEGISCSTVHSHVNDPIIQANLG